MDNQHAIDGQDPDGARHTAPQFDADQARAFVAALVPGGLGPYLLEIRLLHPHKGANQGYFKTPAAIPWKRVAAANAQEWSVTVGGGLRARKGGRKDDVGALTALWADLDAKNFAGS